MIRNSILLALTFFCVLPSPALIAKIPANWEAKYEWHPENSTSGPVLVVVDLDAQEALVFRNGVEIAKTPVSTGKPGHSTPTGIFQILNKDADHHSSTYNNASMPFSERLTWSGVALHAGGLPGYPSSHGCIHMPYSFAKKLFTVTHKGTTVVITKKGHAPEQGVQPAHALLGLENAAIADGKLKELDDSVMWKPHLSKDGSVTVFLSGKHHKAEVFRNGVLIGHAPLKLRNPKVNLPTAVLLLLEGSATSSIKGHRWATLSTSGSGNSGGLTSVLADNVILPHGFASRVLRLVEPGTLVITTAEEVTADTRANGGFSVLRAINPLVEKSN